MHRTALLGAAAVIALLTASGLPASAADAPPYKPVTQERLDNPEPGNWLMVRGTYNGWGFSPLDQITADNVKELVPAWSLSTGVLRCAPGAAHRQ